MDITTSGMAGFSASSNLASTGKLAFLQPTSFAGMGGLPPPVCLEGGACFGRAVSQASLRVPQDIPKLNLSALKAHSGNVDASIGRFIPSALRTQLRHHMEQRGYALLEAAAKQPSTASLKKMVDELCAAHAPKGRKPPFDRIYIRWQRQLKIPHLENFSKHQCSHPSDCRQGDAAWMLTDAKNCNEKVLSSFPEGHEIFEAASVFFDDLNQQMLHAFPNANYSVTQEVRYIDPLDHAEITDTHWHCDGAPTFLTATTSWLGPGTIYLPENVLGELGHYPQAGSELNHVSGSEAPKGAVISFFGQSGAAEPLWHKSPASDKPRLLLIYRMSFSDDAVDIRPPPNL